MPCKALPRARFRHVLRADLCRQVELLEDPLEAGHAFVRLVAILFPHLQERRLRVTETIAKLREAIVIDLFDDLVVHKAVARDARILHHLLGQLPGIGPFQVVVKPEVVSRFQHRVEIDDDDAFGYRSGNGGVLCRSRPGQRNQPGHSASQRTKAGQASVAPPLGDPGGS